MSDMVELSKDIIVNRDNINDVRIGIAGKGSKSLISIGYVDSIGKAYYFDTP